jgi:superfamily II DNA or RNA helicase
LATGRYVGEGFDDARLDTLFLVMPISWRGTLQQYVGRLHRLHENKRVAQVYDYVDKKSPMLMRMYSKRLIGYKALGYKIEKPNPNQN